MLKCWFSDEEECLDPNMNRLWEEHEVVWAAESYAMEKYRQGLLFGGQAIVLVKNINTEVIRSVVVKVVFEPRIKGQEIFYND